MKIEVQYFPLENLLEAEIIIVPSLISDMTATQTAWYAL